ncbi:isocitrate lyase/PEP mutase family protein [Clostridium cellulovorans]|uniref:2,3-dimethylmalate lyase n=1 Tax=Clostridium cellulovorans (strain ATCC 35296 / DSM 3052 / OCM 3 / 743B) TaxID=573061 RepID=D9SPL5_CLOC7|nr:isocitrate lyase/phosphoenolpyruvate mutase family protein [Clostridium cellulovorans]ADL50064.1 2,3-dimethylmalate lyase [Clostridium cellulovorans 743B]
MSKDSILKKLLNSKNTLIMPDAFDPISAKIIEYAGFSAIQCSGYSYSISKGYKSEEDIDLNTNLKLTKEIVDSVNIPVMADGEDGYGEGDEFENTIRKFIDIGVSGINIEDQVHNLVNSPLKIIDEYSMLAKIKAANKTKNSLGKNDFILNARTDALRSMDNRKEAQKLAIERANSYLEAGADLCFITYTQTLEEVKLFSKEINGPISIAAGLPYNIQEFSINDCINLGIARVSLPTFMILNSIDSMVKTLIDVKNTGSFDGTIRDNTLLSDGAILNNIIYNKF